MKIALGYVTITTMKKLRGQQGSADALLLPLIIASVLFVGAASFGVWAFMGRQDYKNHSDAKVQAAVTANTKKVQEQEAAKFAEEAKNPLKEFKGPDAYGGLRVSYPKTWSAYTEASSTNVPLDAYFHTDFVPATQSKQTYQLRVEITDRPYDTELARYKSNIDRGLIRAAAYSLPEVSSVVGTRLDGAVVLGNSSVNGSLVIVPLRDKTLRIWTESNDYLADFNNNILPNVTFSP